MSVKADGVLAAPIDSEVVGLLRLRSGRRAAEERSGEGVVPALIDAIMDAMFDPGGGSVDGVAYV